MLNFKNIAIVVLVIFVLMQLWNPGGIMPGKTIRVDGKKYDYEDLLLDPTFKYLLTNDDAPTITKYPYSLQSLE